MPSLTDPTRDPVAQWSHDYWPKEQHTYILELIRRDHGGELPAWARAADLVTLYDLAKHPTHPEPVPGRRPLEARWGASERATKATLAAKGWREKVVAALGAAGVELLERHTRPQSRPRPAPVASPPPSPPPTDEPKESAETAPAAAPTPAPVASPPASPTRARSSHGPYGPTVLSGEGAPPSPPSTSPRFTTAGLRVMSGSPNPLEQAAAEGALRLLSAGVAPPSDWRTTPPAEQAEAQRRVVEELARRCERAQVTPAELLDACSAYHGRWWPLASALLGLVALRRAELAAADAARQLDLPDEGLVLLATARAAAESASLPVLECDPEPAPVVGLAALEAARQRRAAAGGSCG